jgi:hypothetical protein
MSRNRDLLNRITIPTPCSADWDSMKGNDQVRFCSHCQLSVHNLSAMTRKEAIKLVAESEGRICLRYYKKPGGQILTATSHGLHQIKRRASRLAAGAFTAALSLSASVSAQTPSPSDAPANSNVETTARLFVETTKRQTNGATSSITGTVMDPNDAIIPAADLTLINKETEEEKKTTSNSDGKFIFDSVPAGTYSLRAESPGFATHLVNNINVQENSAQLTEVTVKMEVGQVMGGAMVMVMPSVPIVLAASQNDLAAVQRLLGAGADINQIDEDTNSTALSQAVGNDNLEMVRALLAAGANANAKTYHGNTALMRLSEQSPAEMVWELVYAGAKINHQDDDGNTALMSIATENTPAIVQALVDAGAKVDVRNNNGETALMLAAEDGNLDNVKILITAGADLNLKDKDGHTALKRARDAEEAEMVQLLESYGATE